MTRVDEFDAFYAESRRQVLHQVYALTGDLAASAAAVEDAYAHAWQHWPKVRNRDPLGYVRPEAWRVALLRHSAHLLRRRHGDGADTVLLEALGDLSTSARRLVILQTLAGLDLSTAAREVGVTVEQAVAVTDTAVAAMLRRLGGSLRELEARLDGLRRTTDAVSMPRASRIRRDGQRRQRRNTVVAAIGAVAVLAGSGVLVTAQTPAAGGDRDIAATPRPVAGPTSSAPEPPGATAAQLLGTDAPALLDSTRPWRLRSTAHDLTRTQPYAPCQERRFANTRVRDAWVRTFALPGPGDQQLVQAVEVSPSETRAATAARRMLQWYAGCDEPRTRLEAAHSIRRDGPDDVIVTLRQFSRPVRTFTVGVSRSGVVTTALVHSVDGVRGARPQAFGDLMDEAQSLVCSSSGGPCDPVAKVRPAPLPRTGEGPGFLGVVDLPPVARLTSAWVGTRPARADPNPSATLCGDADFDGPGVNSARSRVYVMPRAKFLPEEFGLSETVVRFDNAGLAAASVRRFAATVRACPDRNLTAAVETPELLHAGRVVARTWRISYEIDDNRTIEYWLGFVRRGEHLAQLAFSAVPGGDLEAEQFRELALRAGERLRELD